MQCPAGLADADGAVLLAGGGLTAEALAQRFEAAGAAAQQVRSLSLDGNALTELPRAVLAAVDLRLLRALWLDGNRLRALPAALGRCTSLERLHAAGNLLESVPEELGELVALRALNLSRNQLSILPDDLGRCSLLENVWLSGNRLQALPESFRRLAALRMLWANDNDLRAVPDCTGSWMSLEQLQLGNNPALGELPAGLGFCSSLKRLGLQQCPALRLPPAEVVSQGVEAVRAFLRTRSEQGLVRCWCARWIFAGFERVGKTSLARALRGLSFNAQERSTDGLGVESLLLDADSIRRWLPEPGVAADALPGDGEALEVSLWDLAGQSVYHLTHEVFLSSHAVYILPWRCDLTPPPEAASGTDDHGSSWSTRSGPQCCRTDLGQLNHWLSCIRVRSPNAVVIIVGTHAETDDRGMATLSDEDREKLCDPQEPESLLLRQRYPGLQLYFFLVDSATGFGLPAIRSTLLRLTLRGSAQPLPLVVPKDWFALRERCHRAAATVRVPLEPWDRFEADFAGDCPKVREAVEFWHVLGHLLFFSAAPADAEVERPAALPDESGSFVVLQPQWLANFLRCVVTQTGATEEIRRCGGAVAVGWLQQQFAAVGLASGPAAPLALRLLERLEVAVPWRPSAGGPGGVASCDGLSVGCAANEDAQYLFPGLLPLQAALTAESPECSPTPFGHLLSRDVLVQLPSGTRSVSLFSRVLFRALRIGGMSIVAGCRLVVGRASLQSLDKQVFLELCEVEGCRSTSLRLRAAAAPDRDRGTAAATATARRRDDALRRALAQVLALIATSFPGLLPGCGAALERLGAGLLRLECRTCADVGGLGLLEVEDHFAGQGPAPRCGRCGGAEGDTRQRLGQPVPFAPTSFRPLLRGTMISVGIEDLIQGGRLKEW